MKGVKARTARDFNHTISYHEWRLLTARPWLIGIGAGVAGFVLGYVLHTCGGW